MNQKGNVPIYVALGITLTVGFILSLMFGLPVYGVWQQGLSGKANLAKAVEVRKIMIEQAKAEKEAASIRADAIQIIGQAAKDFPEYRLQEFMGAFAEALNSDKIEQIIYVPTEANIPIMEAGRIAIQTE